MQAIQATEPLTVSMEVARNEMTRSSSMKSSACNVPECWRPMVPDEMKELKVF